MLFRIATFSPTHFVLLALMLFSTLGVSAEGGLRLNQTRMIFPQNSKNVALTLFNSGGAPYLIKGTVGREMDIVDNEKALPFTVVPPLFRLEANSRHTVVVVKDTTTSLPTDRESVFYLSLLAIPTSSPSAEGDTAAVSVAASVSVGIRSTIKLFYRPSHLPMRVEDAAKEMTFQSTPQGIRASNPTPYYLTFAELTVDHQPLPLAVNTAMVAPFSSQLYPSVPARAGVVTWRLINDYGGNTPEYRAQIAQMGAQP